jgi:hypothetical protein
MRKSLSLLRLALGAGPSSPSQLMALRLPRA